MAYYIIFEDSDTRWHPVDETPNGFNVFAKPEEAIRAIEQYRDKTVKGCNRAIAELVAA